METVKARGVPWKLVEEYSAIEGSLWLPERSPVMCPFKICSVTGLYERTPVFTPLEASSVMSEVRSRA